MSFLTTPPELEDLRKEAETAFPKGPRRDEALPALRPSKHVVVIVQRGEEGSLTGVAQVWKTPDTANTEGVPAGRYVRLRNMATSRSGEGKALLDAVREHAKSLGAGIYLSTLEGADPFYQKHGFKEAIGSTRYLTHDDLTSNVFCPTGPGGGVDPSCSPGGKKYKWKSSRGGDREVIVEGIKFKAVNFTKDVGHRHWNLGIEDKNGRTEWFESGSTLAEIEDMIPAAVTAEKENQWAILKATLPTKPNPLPQLSDELKSEKVNSAPTYLTLKKMTPKEVSVPIDQLVSTQSWIRPASVEHLSRQQDNDIPKVDLWRGKYVITDGNHRVLAAKNNAKQTIKVLLTDLDAER